VTITSSLAAPSTPDLTNASDDGASNSDNITSIASPTFTGTGPTNTTIELLTGGNTVVGSATSNAQGAWSITVSSPLAIGTYSFNRPLQEREHAQRAVRCAQRSDRRPDAQHAQHAGPDRLVRQRH